MFVDKRDYHGEDWRHHSSKRRGQKVVFKISCISCLNEILNQETHILTLYVIKYVCSLYKKQLIVSTNTLIETVVTINVPGMFINSCMPIQAAVRPEGK